LVEVN